MKTPPLTFLVNSPQELSEAVKAQSQNILVGGSAFAAVALSGPQVLVRIFSFKDINLKDIKAHVQTEAVGLLSLPLNEIEFDYQVLGPTADKVNGIFCCVPRKLLKEYLDVLDEAKLVPVKMTAAILATVESFHQKYNTATGRCCLLDLSSPHKINLAIFSDRQCEFLREITYDDLTEARAEIIQALRSAAAASKVKQFDQIYCFGELTEKEELVRQLENNLQAKIELGPALDVSGALTAENNFFTINLAKPYSFSSGKRKQIAVFLNQGIVVSIGVNILLAAVSLYLYTVDKSLKSSYKASEYEYAQKLEQQLKSLK